MKQEKVLEIIVQEAKKNKNILALGIGGSFARKENDFLSDIDLYIITSQDSASAYSDIVNKFSTYLPKVLNYNNLGIHQGFGYLYQISYELSLMVDYNFNTINSLHSHPTWRNRTVIYDKTSEFEKFIQTEKNKWTNDELYKYHYDLLPKLTNIFWQDSYLKAYKSIFRGNLLSAIRYQQRMKEILFYLIRLHFRLYANVPDYPFKNVESDFKEYPEILKIFKLTQPSYSLESVIESINNTLLFFEKYVPSYFKTKKVKNILKTFPLQNLLQNNTNLQIINT